MWTAVDRVFECLDDTQARDRLEQRIAFAAELAAADAFGLPLEFGSSKKKPGSRKKERRKRNVDDAANRFVGVDDRYWAQRHLYFNLYDDGIQLDPESWFSVTPERIAQRIASRTKGIVVDAFCGCGGNAIQFAKAGCFVLAVDLDVSKLMMARHNAAIYDVLHRIDFLYADAIDILPTLKADVVFLSPPWGGPAYQDLDTYNLSRDLILPSPGTGGKNLNGLDLAELAAKAAPNLAYFLPKNTALDQALNVAKAVANARHNSYPYRSCHFVSHYLNGRLKAKTLFLGPDCAHPSFLGAATLPPR